MSYKISELFEEHYIKDRDQKVLDQITRYLSNNHEAMLDGFYKTFVIFGSTNEQRIANLYDISNSEWNSFKSRHSTLARDFKVSGSLMRMGLVDSYYVTKERLFLDFLAITMFGSRWSVYFKHNVKEHIMKYVVEKELTMKSYIKKYGSSFVVLQETVTTILDDTKSGKNQSILSDNTDDNMIYLINTIYSRINALLKTLANHYYDAERNEKSGYIISVSDDAEEGKLSLSNNSLKVSNLKNLIENKGITTVDDMILKTLRIDDPLKRSCVTSILLNKKEKIFDSYANMYLDYYIKQNGNDWVIMKNKFIQHSNAARMNTQELRDLDSRVVKLIREYVKAYTKLSNIDAGDLKLSNGVIKLCKTIKDYIIIRVRALMNEVD